MIAEKRKHFFFYFFFTQDQKSSCTPQTFLSLLVRVVVSVPFGVRISQLRLSCLKQGLLCLGDSPTRSCP